MTPYRPRILLVVLRFPKFSETFIVTKLRGLLERGWDVHVTARQSEDEMWDLFPDLRTPELEGRVHLAAWGELRNAVREVGPDIVHFEFGEIAQERIAVLDDMPVKKVVSFRGPDLNFMGLDEEGFYDAVWEQADAIHFLGDDLRDRALRRGCPADKPHAIIPPALRPEVLKLRRRPHRDVVGTKKRPLRVVLVGRLHWMKGYEYAFDALRILRDKGVAVDCRVVGDDPDYYEGKRQALYAAHDIGVPDLVTFLGARPQLETQRHVRWADVFLHGAVSEGFCNAVLEAQALGVPVVTSDADGLPANVLNRKTGFVVRRRDPRALANKLIALARDPKLRESMGSAGRERARAEFSIDRQLDSFEELYRGLAPRPSRDERILRLRSQLEEIQSLQEQARVDLAAESVRAEAARQLRDAVADVTPPGSVVAVVSRGDDSLLKLGNRDGWHFPQSEEGVYSGHHPASSREAIEHLKEVRQRGAQYIAFPQTSMWWLEHYDDFRSYIERYYHLVADGGVRVYSLAPRARRRATGRKTKAATAR